MNIGPQLRALIDEVGLTPAAFARLAGLSPQRINDLLHDRKGLTLATLEHLAEVLDDLLPGGCSPADLLPPRPNGSHA